jgi:hypothetical protein
MPRSSIASLTNPFAEESGLKPHLLEQLGEECVVGWHGPRGVPVYHVGLRAEQHGVAPRHERRTSWRTNRLHIVVGECDAACRKGVQVGGEQASRGVHEADFVVSKVIRENE